MAEVHDYLEWRGDVPVTQANPFNEIDAMICTRLAYLPFERIELETEETIRSIAIKMAEFELDDFRLDDDYQMLMELGISPRFRDIKVTDFVKDNSMELEMQFAAVTLQLSEDVMHLSFCGTDSTVLGWKEDMNMSFMDNVPGQHAACDYAKFIAEKYPDKKMRFGGHSKGGNLAVFAAVGQTEEVQNRIIEINNYDGPGFVEKYISQPEYLRIKDRIHTYIPQDSLFGRLLEHAEPFDIVESTNRSIYQHDLYSWQVMKDHLIRLERTTEQSNITNESIRRILENTSPAQRGEFLDEIYTFIDPDETTTIGDIKEKLPRMLPRIIKAVSSMGETEKQEMTNMLAVFIKSFTSSFSDTTHELTHEFIKDITRKDKDTRK